MKDLIRCVLGVTLWLCAIATPVGCQYIEKQGPEWLQDKRSSETGGSRGVNTPSGLWVSSLLTMVTLFVFGAFTLDQDLGKKK